MNSIEAAAPNGVNDKDPSLIAKAETLLDPARFSPGEIDGMDGDNYRTRFAPSRKPTDFRRRAGSIRRRGTR